MPTFDFVCRDCSNRFSRFVRLSEKDKATCTHCGGSDIEQVFTVVNFTGGGKNADTGTGSTSCGSGSCGTCSGC